MKSIILIDKPDCCYNCIMNNNQMSCWVTETSFKDFDMEKEILEDCPLKDLPDKIVCNERDFEHYDNAYGKGWNDYRGHITGEYNNYTPEPYKE